MQQGASGIKKQLIITNALGMHKNVKLEKSACKVQQRQIKVAFTAHLLAVKAESYSLNSRSRSCQTIAITLEKGSRAAAATMITFRP